MGIKSPCLHCKNRQLYCHSHCKEYIDYTNALQVIKDKRNAELNKDREIYDYQIRKHKRLGR